MFFKKIGFLAILGPPSGIGATIRIGQEMLCLPYEGFFVSEFHFTSQLRLCFNWKSENGQETVLFQF